MTHDWCHRIWETEGWVWRSVWRLPTIHISLVFETVVCLWIVMFMLCLWIVMCLDCYELVHLSHLKSSHQRDLRTLRERKNTNNENDNNYINTIEWSNVNENGRVRDSENLCFHKSNEKKNWQELSESTFLFFFSNLEINQRLAAIWAVWWLPKKLARKACLYFIRLRTCPVLKPLPRECLLKTFTGQCFSCCCLKQ